MPSPTVKQSESNINKSGQQQKELDVSDHSGQDLVTQPSVAVETVEVDRVLPSKTRNESQEVIRPSEEDAAVVVPSNAVKKRPQTRGENAGRRSRPGHATNGSRAFVFESSSSFQSNNFGLGGAKRRHPFFEAQRGQNRRSGSKSGSRSPQMKYRSTR